VGEHQDDLARRALTEQNVRVVRAGHGANCSSIGSVIDTLFATATMGAAVFAAVLGALRKETVRVVGEATAEPPPPRAETNGAAVDDR
jgi:hypothetical protein